MIRTVRGSYYTGITTDVERRFKEHCGGAKAAKFFRSTKPEALVWVKICKTRGAALRLESKVKKLRQVQKIALIG